MTRKGKLAVVLVAATALAWLAAGCSKSSNTAKPQAKGGPVLVQAFYPLTPEHKYIADYVRTLDKKYPGKVKVEVYDVQTPEGRDMYTKTGLGCMGVFINGRTRHIITRANGKKETVDFLKRMDEFWSKADFETVLKQQIAHPSPLPPGGFSTSAEGAPTEKPAQG